MNKLYAEVKEMIIEYYLQEKNKIGWQKRLMQKTGLSAYKINKILKEEKIYGKRT